MCNISVCLKRNSHEKQRAHSISGVLVSLNNWLSRTCQSSYLLDEIYHAMEWFGFADYIKD